MCLCVNPYQLWIFTEVLFLSLGVRAARDGILPLWVSGSPPLTRTAIPRGILGRGWCQLKHSLMLWKDPDSDSASSGGGVAGAEVPVGHFLIALQSSRVCKTESCSRSVVPIFPCPSCLGDTLFPELPYSGKEAES